MLEIVVAVIIGVVLGLILVTIYLNQQRAKLYDEYRALVDEKFEFAVSKIENATRGGRFSLRGNRIYFSFQDGTTTRLHWRDSVIFINQEPVFAFDTVFLDTSGLENMLFLNKFGRWRVISWH